MKDLKRGSRHPRTYQGPGDRRELARQWIDDGKTPYLADSLSTMRPPLVPGYHRSIGLEHGRRLWMFETKEERDAFVQLAWGHDPKRLTASDIIPLLERP